MRRDGYDDKFIMDLVFKQQSERIMKDAQKLDRLIKLRKELFELDVSEFRSDVKERNDILVDYYDRQIEELKTELNYYLN